MWHIRNSKFEIRNSARTGGFTLIELLMAMFILAIGLVAIASIFPVSSYIQKQTFNETMTLQIKRNAESILYAMPVDMGAEPASVSPISNLDTQYPTSVRCYPLMLDADNDGVDDGNHDQREFYWVPLVQKDDTQWRVFAFILSKKKDVDYTWGVGSNTANPDDAPAVPKVRNISASVDHYDPNGFTVLDIPSNNPGTMDNPTTIIQPGNQVLSENGQILQVRSFHENDEGESIFTQLRVSGEITTLNSLWFGVPAKAGQPSPTRRIIVLGGEAVKP